MSGFIRLPRLKPGSLVALEAAAGFVDAERIEGAVNLLETRGYRVLLPRDLTARDRYFAGTDAERLAGLNAALGNPEVCAVFLARGGYGSQRIAPHLSKPASPKAVVGFSDNTALLSYVGEAFGWPSIHGPHPRADHPEEFDRVLACLAEGALPAFEGLADIRGGKVVEAPVAGGCLSLLSATFGTPCFPLLAGRIVFLEDTCEAPYRLDRMLTHLLQAGAFAGALAVVFGKVESFAPQGVDAGETLAVLEDFAARVGVPVAAGLPCGHVEPNFPLFFGPRARLDIGGGTLTFLEGLTA